MASLHAVILIAENYLISLITHVLGKSVLLFNISFFPNFIQTTSSLKNSLSKVMPLASIRKILPQIHIDNARVFFSSQHWVEFKSAVKAQISFPFFSCLFKPIQTTDNKNQGLCQIKVVCSYVALWSLLSRNSEPLHFLYPSS